MKLQSFLTYKRIISFIIVVVFMYIIIKSGSPGYKTLAIGDPVNTYNDCIFVMAAEWCGHCKKLKESGELEKLNKYIPVVIVPHDHPSTGQMMKNVESKGFPTIIVNKYKKIFKYDGPRNSDSVLSYYRSL